jgi:hypothetical protein
MTLKEIPGMPNRVQRHPAPAKIVRGDGGASLHLAFHGGH